MTRLVLDIPDSDVEEFLKYIKKFPSKEIEIGNEIVLDEEIIKLLDQSSAIPLEKCISREQLKKKLENAI